MKNSKFWIGKKELEQPIQPNPASNLKEASVPNIPPMKSMKVKNKENGKKWLKSLGATGIALILVGAIVVGVSYVYVVKPAFALMSTVNVLKEDGGNITEALKNRDLIALEEALQKTEKDLEKIGKQRESSFGWAKDVKAFKLDEFYADGERFINAGFYAVDALRETSVVMTPFADAAGLRVSEEQEVVEQEGLMEAFQSWISIMPEVADQMDGVIEKVDKIGQELEPINVDKYPEEIRGIKLRGTIEFVKNTLSQANEYGTDIKQALTLFPRILGIGTPVKRYMIIMQNDKELRPTGGFMTNYATFKIQDALLQSDFTSKDMYSIDNALDIIDATYDFPDAPAAYMKYLKVERWYARDMNASPDFPTSMDQFMTFYNMAGRLNPYEIKPVDGIIAINTNVIAELLEVTGPVTVNGITYTHENVVLELEMIASLELREQVNRKRVLGDLMEAMLVNVFESDKNLWSTMIDKTIDLAIRKHILVYIFDEEAETLFDRYNVSGRVMQDVEGDYVLAVSANLGGDKTNWFVNKEVDHTLENVDGRWLRTTKLTYSYVEPSADYGHFVKRFKDWMRLYVPLGSEAVSVEGSEDGTLTDQELDKTYMTSYIELGPGESKEVVFKYYLPDDVVKDGKYTLQLQKQSGIDSEVHRIHAGGKTQEIDLYKDIKVSIDL